ncbi:hypothetical protein F5I97DRAFT_1930004 [Phlebopus sp. FC_14]|nr:hypothetical protein F5I97DRAFT_1930004 [Phlebopus sp. FC_14]
MSLKIPMPTNADLNRMTYKAAAKLREEWTRPGGRPEKLDFGTVPSCSNCNAPIMNQKTLVCGGCKSAVYCSKTCQSANWKVGIYGSQNHRVFCQQNKRHMQRVPQVQAILKQFPWGKLESDGTFAEPFIRAYYGVLGAEGFGYWSTSGGTMPHQLQPSVLKQGPTGPFSVSADASYQDGYLLLLDQHLDENAGWKLEDRLIPKLHFKNNSEPVIASSVNVVDWKSWYEWRGLPMESPAALLMHYPLSTYHLLLHVLHVTHPARNSPAGRQTLNVHYLGPEAELNMLPIFSELALLLPYTDIKLTFFGFAVYNIVKQARKKSIAMKAKRSDPVYTYTSPTSMGGGTLSIYLHGEHENWDPRLPSMAGDIPDAIVACNAGLLSYPAWQYVILYCHVENRPFAVTEYAEQSAEVHRDAFPQIIAAAMPHLEKRMSTAELENMIKPRQYPIEFNPFQRPGQRTLGSTRLPNVSNGFTVRVIGNEVQEEKMSQYHGSEAVSSCTKAGEGLQKLVEKAKELALDNLD